MNLEEKLNFYIVIKKKKNNNCVFHALKRIEFLNLGFK